METNLRALADEFADAGFDLTACGSGFFFASSFDDSPCSRPAHSLCFYEGCEGLSLLPVCRTHSADASAVLAMMGRHVVGWLPVARKQ